MSELIPNGSQTLSKARGRFPGAYPRSLVSADKNARTARVMDAGSRVYLDWICALGAISLGYRDDEVDRYVCEQVMDGPIFSLPNVELEERVAQRLVDLIPCAASARFVKTGSEATEAAIRVARAATGRDVILTCGYHSWHSWYAATREEHPGVPEAMTKLVRAFRYNATMNALDGYGNLIGDPGEIAAIILEPTLIDPPAPGFLQSLRDTATNIGAVLIFDEMVTGFRWHAGGAQAFYGVTPDLATFGKGMGNGYPIAALVGRADLMRHARLVSGTFGGDCIGLAAADATLTRYQQGGVCEHMWRIGRLLMEGYDALALRHGLDKLTRMVGQPPHPVIRWEEYEEIREVTAIDGVSIMADGGVVLECRGVKTPHRYLASLFFQETVRRGILLGPDGNNVMFAHTEDDVATTLAACDEALQVVADGIVHGDVCARIEGDPIDPAPAWRVAR